MVLKDYPRSDVVIFDIVDPFGFLVSLIYVWIIRDQMCDTCDVLRARDKPSTLDP